MTHRIEMSDSHDVEMRVGFVFSGHAHGEIYGSEICEQKRRF